jgi:hypothetical protein
MSRIRSLVAAAVLLAPSAATPVQAADAPKVCLNASEIQRTEVPDDRTIIFHMRDGKVWRNSLRTVCPMLKVSPYTQKLNGDLVCSNQQFIHVTLTGDDCVLGDFSPLPPER